MADTTNFDIELPTPGGFRNQWGGSINSGLSKIDELLALALPIGSVQMYAKSSAPSDTANGGKWLVCDGASLVRSTYADLFSAIGTTYGTADSTHFNVPDMRSRAPVGYNGTAGLTGRSTRAINAVGGAESVALSTAQLASHAHGVTDPGHTHSATSSAHTHTGSVNNSTTSIAVSDAGHNHLTFATNHVVDAVWQPGGDGGNTGNGSGIDGDIYGQRKANNNYITGTANASIQVVDNGHVHSYTTGATTVSTANASQTTGISTTQNNYLYHSLLHIHSLLITKFNAPVCYENSDTIIIVYVLRKVSVRVILTVSSCITTPTYNTIIFNCFLVHMSMFTIVVCGTIMKPATLLNNIDIVNDTAIIPQFMH